MASVIGVGVTGVAGPGLQEGKPAGLVFAAAARVGEGGNWQFAERAMRPSAELPVTGDRSEVRLLAVELGLSTVFDISAHR